MGLGHAAAKFYASHDLTVSRVGHGRGYGLQVAAACLGKALELAQFLQESSPRIGLWTPRFA
jgi:hypothetical protein